MGKLELDRDAGDEQKIEINSLKICGKAKLRKWR
jgi:hypothetical protein